GKAVAVGEVGQGDGGGGLPFARGGFWGPLGNIRRLGDQGVVGGLRRRGRLLDGHRCRGLLGGAGGEPDGAGGDDHQGADDDGQLAAGEPSAGTRAVVEAFVAVDFHGIFSSVVELRRAGVAARR